MNTTKLTLGQAAETVSCSKATLSKALKNGALSGEKREDGSFAIDPAELTRWDGERSRRGKRNQTQTPLETPKNTIENSELQAELKALRDEKIAMLEGQLEDVKTERDEWRKQAQQLALAPPSQDNASEKPVERAGGLLRLFGLRKA